MSKKHLVCQGAECKCNFGAQTDKLKVLTQTKHYINDKDASEKLMATNMDIGMTFEKNTFGQCNMQPTPGGYLPCIPALTKWDSYYEKVTLQENQGKPLLEDSKGMCAIGGPGCIQISNHGQTMEAAEQKQTEAEKELISQISPLMSFDSISQKEVELMTLEPEKDELEIITKNKTLWE